MKTNFSFRHLLIGVAVGVGALCSASAATILQGAGANYVAFEAEGNPTIHAGTPSTWVSTNVTGASGGSALYIAGTTDTAGAPQGFAQYQIRFTTPGSYQVYYRWRADPARTVADQFTANSFFLGNRFGSFTTTGAEGRGDFIQTASNNVNAPDNAAFLWTTEATLYEVSAADIAGGPLTLTIGTREAGFTLDRLVFSAESGLAGPALDALANSETSVIVQGASDAFVAFEAESKAALIPGSPSSWVSTNVTGASAGAALYIAGVTDTAGAPQGFAQFQIRFARAGTYHVFYRWRADPARTVADQFTANSFFLGNRFGSFTTTGADGRADFIQTASNNINAPDNATFLWTTEAVTYEVSAADVASGPLVLTIGTREAGFTLDRIVFHTEPALTGAVLDALPNSGAVVAAPSIASAVGSASLNTVTLGFTRPLAPATVQANRFTLSGGVAVTAATLDPNDPRRVILATGLQTPGTAYTVSVTGVTDTGGSPVAANTSKNFTAWKLAEGWATLKIFLGIPGSFVSDLTASDAYLMDTPSEIRFVKGFELNNDPRGANIGAELSAFFTPATSGAHNFYVSSDDESELLLSADQSADGLQSMAVFPLTPVEFTEENVIQSSPLTANTRYLLAGRVKSGGGDFRHIVAAQPSASATPASQLAPLAGARISTFVNPDAGNVTFDQQPTNATAAAGDRARFSVKVTASEAPVYYQWRVNGADIPGATRSAYITPALSAADHGKIYSVVVSVAGKDTPSASATLAVQGSSTSNLAPYIGVNFVGGGDNVGGLLNPLEAAGVVPQENWNNLAGAQFEGAALRNAAGAETPVTLSAAATEHWYSGTLGAGDANGVLLQGFLSTGASLDPFLITLNGVPADNYHLIVYSIGFPFSADYQEDISVTGQGNYPTYTVKAETGLEFNASPSFRRMSSVNPASRAVGNYVQFENVRPAADGSLVISATWTSTAVGNTHQPAVNGIQLVKVGAPVVIPGNPPLSVSQQGNAITISWTSSANGFTLESSASLGAAAAWAPAAGAPNPITGAGTLSVNPTSARQFFRLRHP